MLIIIIGNVFLEVVVVVDATVGCAVVGRSNGGGATVSCWINIYLVSSRLRFWGVFLVSLSLLFFSSLSGTPPSSKKDDSQKDDSKKVRWQPSPQLINILPPFGDVNSIKGEESNVDVVRIRMVVEIFWVDFGDVGVIYIFTKMNMFWRVYGYFVIPSIRRCFSSSSVTLDRMNVTASILLLSFLYVIAVVVINS